MVRCWRGAPSSETLSPRRTLRAQREHYLFPVSDTVSTLHTVTGCGAGLGSAATRVRSDRGTAFISITQPLRGSGIMHLVAILR